MVLNPGNLSLELMFRMNNKA